MSVRAKMTRRLCLAAAAAALSAACAPLSLFATLAPADPAIRSARNAAFGPAPRQRLDVFAPRGASGDAPVAVFFYGGSWDSGRRQDYSWVGKALASRGFVTVIPDYGLYPTVRYPAFGTAEYWTYCSERPSLRQLQDVLSRQTLPQFPTVNDSDFIIVPGRQSRR